MVQEVLKAAMDEPTRRLWAERAVRAVEPSLPARRVRQLALCGRLLPHALAVASWIERDRMEFAEAGRLLNQTAYYLYERGQYAEAEPLYLQAMEIRRTALGERHPDYATSLNNLAGLYRAMGRHAEAEPLYRAGEEIRRAALGERHPDYAASLNNLAGLYDAMGRHAEAEPLYQQAMEIRRTALGERHPDYATSLNNLAGLYRRDGPARRGRAALLRGDGDSSHGPGRAAPRLRHLAEQPGGAVPTRWAGTPRPSRSSCRRWRFAAPPWASGTPTTPPR